MADKILLADDSQTIQKVISITLASGPYELATANNEEELWAKLEEQDYSLVLLDIDISDNITGYELAKKIREKYANSKILLFYGTFDTIDEDKIFEAGISEKLVKPFDSSHFIEIIKSLLNEGSESPSEKIVSGEEDGQFNVDNWLVKENQAQQEVATLSEGHAVSVHEEVTNPAIQKGDLLTEFENWGLSVPGVIDDDSKKESDILMPPIINGQDHSMDVQDTSSTKTEAQEDITAERRVTIDENNEIVGVDDRTDIIVVDEILAKEEQITDPSEEESDDEQSLYPENEDLEYPDISRKFSETKAPDTAQEESNSDDEPGSDRQALENVKLSSKLIPMEELNLTERETTNETEVGEKTQTKILEKAIEEESSQDEFWAVDENKDQEFDDDATSEFQLNDFSDDLMDAVDEAHSSSDDKTRVSSKGDSKDTTDAASSHIRIPQSLEQDLEDKLRPLIEQLIKEYFKETVEKVAWEIMPDLAENLIKEELHKISQSVQE